MNWVELTSRKVPLTALIVLSTVAVFVLDLLVPLGLAVWLLYLGVVLLSLWLPSRRQTFGAAAACTALMVLGMFCSPLKGDIFWMAVFNRLLGILGIWLVAIVGLSARRALELEEANCRLQQEMLERERLQGLLLRTQRLESIGVLASGVAHDFNNLLTPILMAVKLLREDRSDDERQELLGTLQASTQRGADMVRQLLSFAGTPEEDRTVVHPGQVIKEVKTILEHTFPKTVRIQVQVGADLSHVSADPTQLAQALMNLCVNARDSMPTGGTLTIQAEDVQLDDKYVRQHPEAKQGRFVRIVVTDTGVGIPADVIDRIFDPFFTTKGPGKGTGLGLSTTLGIAKNHGGFMEVNSRRDKGSSFALFLPVYTREEASLPMPVESKTPQGKGELILVVDDEPFILETARATLEGAGYSVLTALDGEEALSRVKHAQSPIHAMVLDMMMPGLDGLGTLKALDGVGCKILVVASSGLRLSRAVLEDIERRHGAVLPKPYTAEQMLMTLASMLSGQERADDLQATELGAGR